MEDIYNSYLSGKEREEAIEESSIELLFNKLDMMYEMADMEYQNDIQSAEFKVLKESGTYDDLQYLVEVATDENTEKKKGIIKTLIEAIANIFKKIADAMHKFVIKGNDEEEADVPDDFIKKHNAIMDFWNKWRNAIPNIVKGEKQNGDGIIAAIESVLALGTAGVGTAVVMRKIKLSKMKEYKNNEAIVNEGMSRVVNTTQNALAIILDNSTPNNQDNGNGKSKNGILDFIKKILGKLKDFANFVKNTFNQLVNIIKTKFKSTKSDKAENNEPDNTSENNNSTNNSESNETKTNNTSNVQNNQTTKNQTQTQNENKPTQTQNNQSQNNNQNQQPAQQQQQVQPDNNQQTQQPENNSKKTIVFTKMYGNNLSENDIGKEYKLKVKSGKKNKWQKQGTITKDMINNKTLAGKQVKVGNYQESTELDDIFGLNLISEMAQYETNETDKDMKELSNLFESLF